MNPDTPILRGLIKIHKEDTPIRPVINSINAPSYKLAKMFAKKLETYRPLTDIYNVKNSIQLIEELGDIPFDPSLKLASFDIANMYTNIPTKELIHIIDSICDLYNVDNSVKQEILTISSLLISQNCFKFQDKTHLQRNSLAMGAPMSSISSEVFLQYTENTAIQDILRTSEVEGYFKYVDDVLIIYKEDGTNTNEILNQFNNITPGLNFTLEHEQDNKINFLDLTISRDINKFSININRTPTTTDVIIP